MPTLLDSSQVIQAVYDEALNRLRVDIGANITLGGELEIFIDQADDSIRIGDGVNLVTTTTVGPKIGLDVNLIGGTISASVALDAFTKIPADNAIAVGTEDGTQTGVKHALVVGSDLNLKVIDTGVIAVLNSLLTAALNIENSLPAMLGQQTMANSLSVTIASNQVVPVSASSLPLPIGAATETKQDAIITALNSIDAGIPASLGQQLAAASVPVVLASNQPPISVAIDGEPIKISGTINGTPSGTEYTFVNNLRQQILAAHDREQNITYADFGTKNERVTQIDYASATFPGITARKVLLYTLVGTKYRRNSINWVIIT
jgi:hypothetical protein